MPQLHAIVLAARPKTLPAAVVPVWLGCVLAWRTTGQFSPTLALATLAGALAIQIATNFFNDAIDSRKGADTTRRLGPTRVTASGLMSPRTVLACGCAFLALAFACGMMLYHTRGWPIAVIGLPSLFLAYGYTGGPYPLAYRGLGEVFVLLFFGWVAVMGTVFIQTGTWPPAAALLGLQVGLLSAVLISINNLRDHQEDTTTGKRTLAVRWGPRAAITLIGLELTIACLASLAWLPLGLPSLTLAALPILALGSKILHGVRTQPPGPAYNRLLATAGGLMVLFAATFHLAALA